MNNHNPPTLTRRSWLGAVSTPALAAALLPSSSSATEPVAGATAHDKGARLYNIRDFGAKGDGTTLDTAALQAAIDACTRDGGGTVLVPSGTFVIGTTEREYFGVWGEDPVGPPAYGLFARNVKGLALNNVRFTVAETATRTSSSTAAI